MSTIATRWRILGRGGAKPVLVLLVLAMCGFADGPTPLDSLLPGTPLEPPLNITGGFCEYRVGHFHAGLDMGTGGRVGRPVLAPADGWIERVRTSGVGYGRSLYLRTTDRRLLQFGHLDAFVDPIDSWVRARQDSSGQYEQDLWTEPGQFRFKAGERMAWSGESGAGGPHLHFEIRRGDMAYHPLRAGLSATDSTPPTLAGLTLEPLDDTSFVAGGAAPYTIRLGAAPETLQVRGRMRAIVAARDGIWRGVDRMVPWSVSMTWEGQQVECRFDSVSWATDMPEGGYVYDSGRVIGEKGVVLWAPAGFRPRVLLTSAPSTREAGTIQVRDGDGPRPLELEARDVAGNRVRRTVLLSSAPRRVASPKPAASRAGLERLELVGLPGGGLRVTDRAAPAGSRNVTVEVHSLGRRFTATPGPAGWTAVVPLGKERRSAWAEEIAIRGEDAQGAPWVLSQLGAAAVVAPGESSGADHHGRTLRVPAGAVFEPGVVLFHPSGTPLATSELSPLAVAFTVAPATMPLRAAVRLSLPLEGARARGAGVYREDADGWEWVSASFDTVRGIVEFDSRRLGRFGLFRDRLAPRAVLASAPKRPGRTAYNRWAIEARVSEEGSGLDARASYLSIDGKRVPTEWDSEARTLRWRPRRVPGAGRHRVTVVAADRAGNVSRITGSFVLD